MQSKELQYQNIVHQARRLYASGHNNAARRACEQLLQFKKNSPEAHEILAKVSWAQGRQPDGVKHIELFLKHAPDDFEARMNLGTWLTILGRGRAAIAHFQRILKTHPGQPFAIAGLATAYVTIGENEKAEAILQPHIDAGTEHWSIARAYTTLQHNKKNFAEAVRIAERHINSSDINELSRVQMCFLLGQSQEKLRDFESAFKSYEQAHNIVPVRFDAKVHDQEVQQLIDVFKPELLAGLPRADIKTDLPVFVISRPRSGSTLVERIIASHPKAHAGGEMEHMGELVGSLSLKIGSAREFPESVRDLDQNDMNVLAQQYLDQIRPLAPTALRITDKNIGNWHRVGLLALLLPQSRIIDLRRDPVDNCLACYASMLDPAHHPYANSLRDLALTYRAYEAMMRHWKNVLSIPILTIKYEDLIDDQEKWTREIIDFCGLTWHDDCLRFHEAADKSKQTASITLSYDQVRQPLYKSSVGRAEKFAPYIGELIDSLDEGRRHWGLDAES